MHPHDTVTHTPEHDEPTGPELRRAIGALLGAAVGDALGAPFEFMPRDTYRSRFPEPVLEGPGEMVGGGTFGWAPGEFTDDTQMGVALAESLLEHGHYEPDAVWARWRTWASTARDIGINTRQSLSAPDWRDVAGDGRRSAGNGALMRAFPLALAMFEATDAAVLDVCLRQAALTHGHPAAGWGAWIGVELTRFAIAGDDIWPELDRLLDDLPDDIHAAFAPVLSPTWTPDRSAPANGTVWGCLAQAVWAVRSTTTFEDAVVAAVALGDDADTVGCVTGAIAGAKYGVDAIPARWVAAVHGSVEGAAGVDRYDAVRLRSAAERLFGLALR